VVIGFVFKEIKMAKIKFEIAEKHIVPLKVVGIVFFSLFTAWIFAGLHSFVYSVFCLKAHFLQFLTFVTFIVLWILSIILYLIYAKFDF